MEISSYNLTWQGFTNCTTQAFKNLKEDEQFSDITLVCGDNRRLKVHKIIISACSSFFRNILVELPQGHLYLYVDGVAFDDLKAAINFMYDGHTLVQKENLDEFIQVCKKLEVEGLCEPDKPINEELDKKNTLEDKQEVEKFEDNSEGMEEASGDVSHVLEENSDEPEGISENVKVENDAKVPEFNFNYKRELIDGERKFICTVCGYSSLYKAHLKNHYQSKHLNIKYPCDQCNYSSGHTSDLAKHKRFKHDQVRAYKCDVCDYKAFDKTGLRNHATRRHSRFNKDSPREETEFSDSVKEEKLMS